MEGAWRPWVFVGKLLGVLLGSSWGPLGVLLGSSWGPLGVLLRSCWGPLKGLEAWGSGGLKAWRLGGFEVWIWRPGGLKA